MQQEIPKIGSLWATSLGTVVKVYKVILHEKGFPTIFFEVQTNKRTITRQLDEMHLMKKLDEV